MSQCRLLKCTKKWNQLDLFKIKFVRSTIVDDIVPPLLSDLCPSRMKQPWVLSIPCAMSIFMDMHVCSDVSIGHTHLSIWLQHDTKYSTVQRSWASPVKEKDVLVMFLKESWSLSQSPQSFSLDFGYFFTHYQPSPYTMCDCENLKIVIK